jgi:hypothetical protein
MRMDANFTNSAYSPTTANRLVQLLGRARHLANHRFRIAMLSCVCLISLANSTHLVAAQQRPAPAKSPMPSTDQMTNIHYYTLRDGMSSTLTLSNFAPTQEAVTVTIFNTEGRPHVLDPISMDPHSIKEVQLADVVPAEGFDEGNIEVAFRGIDMAVTCQVSVVSVEKRISFESREQGMMDFASVNLNGILWLPQKEAVGYLALTDIAKNNVTVQLEIGSKTKVVTLTPRETRLLDLSEELGGQGENDRREAALVRLQHTGLPGDIITTGFVLNLKDGYSSSFTMRDPRTDRSSRLAGAHFRFGAPNAAEGFPEGTQFRAPLFLGNVSDKPISAHVSVDYTVQNTGTADTFSTVAVKSLTIPPGLVQQVELSDELTRKNVGPVAEAGVDITYDGEPGAVLGQLTSVAQSGDYAFEIPIKDPEGMDETMTGVYPWTLDKGTNTVVHLKNTTGDSVNAMMTFLFPGGATYAVDLIALKPYQSVAIDVQKLKDSQKKDRLGHVFPAAATYGQVQWRQEIPYSMIGRAEETNVKAGIAHSFSCNPNCCYVAGTYNTLVTTSSLTEPVGSNIMVTGQSTTTDCNNVTYAPVDAVPQTWTSDSTPIATVSAGTDADDQSVHYVGGGTTRVWGNRFGPYWDYTFSPTGICQARHDLYLSAFAPVTTAVPTSLSLVSSSIIAMTYGEGNCGITWNYGIFVANKYQVLDQSGHAIAAANMEPQEKILNRVLNGNNQGNPLPNWTDIGPSNYPGTSKLTNSNGQFIDAPFGECANNSFTDTFSQPISMLLNGISYSVRTNSWTISSSASGHGSVSNATDIRQSR